MSTDLADNIRQLFIHLEPYQEWLFDLDNTLYAQAEYDHCIFTTLERWLGQQGEAVSGLARKMSAEKLRLGPTYPHLFDDVFADFNLSPDIVSRAIEFYRDERPAFVSKHNLIAQIRANLQGRPLFIVTNGHTALQQHKVKCLGLDSLASKVVYCDKHNPEQLKPSRWAWDRLLADYQFSHPLYVGDSPATDGGFARKAGIDYYRFEYSYEH